MFEFLRERKVLAGGLLILLVGALALSLRPPQPPASPPAAPSAVETSVPPPPPLESPPLQASGTPPVVTAQTPAPPSPTPQWRAMCQAATCTLEARRRVALLELGEAELSKALQTGTLEVTTTPDASLCVDVGHLVHLVAAGAPQALRGLARVRFTKWSLDFQSVQMTGDLIWHAKASSGLLGPVCQSPCKGVISREASLRETTAFHLIFGRDEVFEANTKRNNPIQASLLELAGSFKLPLARMPQDRNKPIHIYTSSAGRWLQTHIDALFSALSREGFREIYWVYPTLDPQSPGGVVTRFAQGALPLDADAMASLINSSSGELQWVLADSRLESRGLRGKVATVSSDISWPATGRGRIEGDYFQFRPQLQFAPQMRSLMLDKVRPVVVVGSDPADQRIAFIAAWLIFHGHQKVMVFPEGSTALQSLLAPKRG